MICLFAFSLSGPHLTLSRKKHYRSWFCAVRAFVRGLLDRRVWYVMGIFHLSFWAALQLPTGFLRREQFATAQKVLDTYGRAKDTKCVVCAWARVRSSNPLVAPLQATVKNGPRRLNTAEPARSAIKRACFSNGLPRRAIALDLLQCFRRYLSTPGFDVLQLNSALLLFTILLGWVLLHLLLCKTNKQKE